MKYTYYLIFLFISACKVNGITLSAYLILYATNDGKTGHVGLAIDNYQIRVNDININGEYFSEYDTIKNNTLTYYDLWPAEDGDFDIIKVVTDLTPKYYKLPAATWEADITVISLIEQGIPHEEGYPCDGMICIPTSPSKDYKLVKYMDALISKAIPFNATKFNCADFIELGLEELTGRKIYAKEFILLGYSTTPNKLFREVLVWPECKLIKDPGKKIFNSFIKEKIFFIKKR